MGLVKDVLKITGGFAGIGLSIFLHYSVLNFGTRHKNITYANGNHVIEQPNMYGGGTFWEKTDQKDSIIQRDPQVTKTYVNGGSWGEKDYQVDHITLNYGIKSVSLIRSEDYTANRELFDDADKEFQEIKEGFANYLK